jgi:threonine synthase
MAQARAKAGIFIDPHTAVAVAVAAKTVSSPESPIVVLSTAHPAKFPAAVKRATGQTARVPPQLAGLLEREERYDIVPNELGALKTYLSERIRPA